MNKHPLTALRQSRGLTLEQAAEEIGVTKTTVWRYERGRIPHGDHMSRIISWSGGAITANDFYADAAD